MIKVEDVLRIHAALYRDRLSSLDREDHFRVLQLLYNLAGEMTKDSIDREWEFIFLEPGDYK
jgi:hypothetical protein